MSQIKIRASLETALASIVPAIDTAYQNFSFTPVTGQPYQELYLLPAEPNNWAMGDGSRQERGIFQINLQYPAGQGPAIAEARAGLIKALFKRGASFTKDGVTVQIERTPEICEGRPGDGRWMVPIRIRYFCNL